MRPKVSTLARFWSHVQKSDDATSCWIWTASRDQNGYGVFRIGSVIDGSRRQVKASRFALEEQLGHPLGAAMQACHTCDNPPCVRNDGEYGHLFEGTAGDNNRDAQLKGHLHRAKVTPDGVREIRRRRSTGESYVSLMQAFGIDRLALYRICTGRTWDVVPGTEESPIFSGGTPRGEHRAWAKLNADLVRVIRQEGRRRTPYVVLSREFGVSPSTIGKIIRREKWAHISDDEQCTCVSTDRGLDRCEVHE